MRSKYLTTIVLFTICISSIKAQEYKLAKTSGKVNVDLGSATIQAYNGNEIIIKLESLRKDDDDEERISGLTQVYGSNVNVNVSGQVLATTARGPESGSRSTQNDRAKGLRVVNASGLQDNTGLGISVKDNGDVVDIQKVTKSLDKRVVIQIPKKLSVKVTNDKINGGTILLKDIETEIEGSVLYNSIKLENVTGPMTLKTTYGSVEGSLGSTLKSPISIISTYGMVDLTVPKNLKANVNLAAPYGDVFAAQDIDIKVENVDNSKYTKWTNDAIKGTINGGGIDLVVKCNYGKIYLRN